MTQEQLSQLAERLDGTQQNVYRLTEQLFNVEVGEEVFTELHEKCSLFKCEECDTWKRTGEESEFREDCCIECEDGD